MIVWFKTLYPVKIALTSHSIIPNFKLAFPAYNKIYFFVSAVIVLLLCIIKEGNFFLRHPVYVYIRCIQRTNKLIKHQSFLQPATTHCLRYV